MQNCITHSLRKLQAVHKLKISSVHARMKLSLFLSLYTAPAAPEGPQVPTGGTADPLQ